MNEFGPAAKVEDAVYKYIQAGHDEIPAKLVFNHEYDNICFLTAASSPPVDYAFHTEKLLSSGQITPSQYRGLPDLSAYKDYAALFLLTKDNDVSLIPLRTNGFIARGRLEKGDVFAFRFDDTSRANTSQYYGCISYGSAYFKAYIDPNNLRRILLSPIKSTVIKDEN